MNAKSSTNESFSIELDKEDSDVERVVAHASSKTYKPLQTDLPAAK